MKNLNDELLLQMYRDMLLGRLFEIRAEQLAHRGLVAGSIHLGIGEEATQAGACAALDAQDFILPSHRTHIGELVKGASPKRLMAEIIGKATGYCGGRAGSSHFADVASANLGVQGIVGAVFPIAVGAALTQKRMNSGRIVLAFFGEGASHQGTFHESLNLSSLWKLPVVWLCVNNLYAMGTKFDVTSSVPNVADRACAYDMPGYTVDGNDVLAIYNVVAEARELALKNKGPTLIETKTYRHRGHSTFDKNLYRPQDEIDDWIKRDPIALFENVLRERNLLDDGLVEEIAREAEIIIDEAEEFAVQSPEPEPESALDMIFSPNEKN